MQYEFEIIYADVTDNKAKAALKDLWLSLYVALAIVRKIHALYGVHHQEHMPGACWYMFKLANKAIGHYKGEQLCCVRWSVTA